jgi:hypothetical protein
MRKSASNPFAVLHQGASGEADFCGLRRILLSELRFGVGLALMGIVGPRLSAAIVPAVAVGLVVVVAFVLRTKAFVEAQASISVPSTENWSAPAHGSQYRREQAWIDIAVDASDVACARCHIGHASRALCSVKCPPARCIEALSATAAPACRRPLFRFRSIRTFCLA